MNIYPDTTPERLSLVQNHADNLGISLWRLLKMAGMTKQASTRWRTGRCKPSNLALHRLLSITAADVERSA